MENNIPVAIDTTETQGVSSVLYLHWVSGGLCQLKRLIWGARNPKAWCCDTPRLLQLGGLRVEGSSKQQLQQDKINQSANQLAWAFI